MKKNVVPFFVLLVFASIGAVVAVLRENNWYFALFAVIGNTEKYVFAAFFYGNKYLDFMQIGR